MIIISGLVGPKPRRRSVGDGQQVNIPVPVYVCVWVRIEYLGAGSWLYPSKLLLWQQMKRPQGWIPMDTVTRKAQKLTAQADRTANRHRCSGRVAQGVRVNLRQGTRQYSDRNFGIRSPLTTFGESRVYLEGRLNLAEIRRVLLALKVVRGATKEPMRLFTKNTGLC